MRPGHGLIEIKADMLQPTYLSAKPHKTSPARI